MLGLFLVPRGEFLRTQHLHDLDFEALDRIGHITPNVVEVLVCTRLVLMHQVILVDESFGDTARLIIVLNDHARLNLLILSVEDDLFVGGIQVGSIFVSSHNQHAVLVQLLHLSGCGQILDTLVIVLVHERLGQLQKVTIESVLELDRSRLAFFQFHVPLPLL